jgi:hypothetical protein
MAAGCFHARLISAPLNGGNTVLRNVDSHTEHTALYPKRLQYPAAHSSHLSLSKFYATTLFQKTIPEESCL